MIGEEQLSESERRGELYDKLSKLLDDSKSDHKAELARLTVAYGNAEVQWVLKVIQKDINQDY